MKHRQFDGLINELINDHSDISIRLKHYHYRIGHEQIRPLIQDVIHYYDTVIQEHSRKEERELVDLSRKEGEFLDVEGLHLSHKILDEGREQLEQVMRNESVGEDVLQQELEHFIQINEDHFLAEENQFFVQELEDIWRRAGSY